MLLPSHHITTIELFRSHSIAQAWILFPSRHPNCVLGRDSRSTDDASNFCASLYSMGKGGVKCQDVAPEYGATRKEALINLLSVVEDKIGRMMIRDGREAKEAREGERGMSGGNGSRDGKRREGDGERGGLGGSRN